MVQALFVALIMAIAPTVIAIVAWHRLSEKADTIHGLVNSNLSTVKMELAKALAEISGLKVEITSLKKALMKARQR